jgi:hypothetical protein
MFFSKCLIKTNGNSTNCHERGRQSPRRRKTMNPGKKLWKIFSLATAIVVTLSLVTVRAPVPVLAHDGDDDDGDHRPVSLPLVSTGLIFGKSMRTIFINRGSRPITLQVSALDADGVVVKQSPLVLEPGKTRTFEVSRSEVARDERSVMLRTEVTLQRADARNLAVSGEVVDDGTGETQPLVVIAVIAILIALWVPEVHAAR